MTFSSSLRIGSGVTLGLVLLGACNVSVRGTQEGPEGDGLGGDNGDGDTAGDGDGDGDGDAPGDGGTAGDGDGDTPGDGDGDTSGDGDGDTAATGGTASGTGGADNGTGGTDNGTGGAAEMSCADAVLDSPTVSVETTFAEDVLTPSCAPGTSPEVIYEWVAPLSDYYSFDTAGSDFDTAVAILSDSCSGNELDCSAGVSGGQFGRGVVKAERDQTYYVVVSGNSGESGTAELSVERVTCPETDLEDQPLPATFSTLGEADAFEAMCDIQGATPQPDKTLRYTATEAGLHRFSASSETYRPVLDVYEGVICGGNHLGCNAGQKSSTSYPAEVTRYLDAGESVTIVVQGEDGAGEFEFNVEKLPAQASGGCYDPPTLGADASGTVPGAGTHEVSTSCSWAGNSVRAFSEHVYKFTVDLSSPAVCSVDVTTGPSGAVYLLEGQNCSGAEIDCRPLSSGGEENFPFSAADNGEYILVVENQDPFGGTVDYTITSYCL